jgi:hypothetical protein
MAARTLPAASQQAPDGKVAVGMDDSLGGSAALQAGGLPPGLAVAIAAPDGGPAMLGLGGDRHASSRR